MRVFKSNLMVLLSAMLESGNASLPLSAELLKDLRVWSAFLADSQSFLPIASPQVAPPLFHKTITTDAAGWKPSSGALIDAGIGVVAMDESSELVFLSARPSGLSLRMLGSGTALGNSLVVRQLH